MMMMEQQFVHLPNMIYAFTTGVPENHWESKFFKHQPYRWCKSDCWLQEIFGNYWILQVFHLHKFLPPLPVLSKEPMAWLWPLPTTRMSLSRRGFTGFTYGTENDHKQMTVFLVVSADLGKNWTLRLFGVELWLCFDRGIRCGFFMFFSNWWPWLEDLPERSRIPKVFNALVIEPWLVVGEKNPLSQTCGLVPTIADR